MKKKMLKRDITRHKLFLKMLIEKRSITSDEQTRVNKIHQKIFGGQQPKFTSCASCLKKRIMDAFKMLQTDEERNEARLEHLEKKRLINAAKNKRMVAVRKERAKNNRS